MSSLGRWAHDFAPANEHAAFPGSAQVGLHSPFQQI